MRSPKNFLKTGVEVAAAEGDNFAKRRNFLVPREGEWWRHFLDFSSLESIF